MPTFILDPLLTLLYTIILVIVDWVTLLPLNRVFPSAEVYLREVDTYVFRYHWWSKLLITASKGFGKFLLMTCIALPLIEEILFFALPLLIHPVLLYVFSIIWIALHVVSYYEASKLAGVKPVKVTASAVLNFGTVGIVKAIYWLIGFGFASILHHVIANTLLSLNDLREFVKQDLTRREVMRNAYLKKTHVYLRRKRYLR